MTLDFKVSEKMVFNFIKILVFIIVFCVTLYPKTNDVFVYNKENLTNAYRYYSGKNYYKAAKAFEYEIENSPILRIEYFEYLANAYMYIKDYTNMLKTARSGIIVNRSSQKLYFQKGYALYKLGDTKNAINAIRQSINLKPNDAYMNNFLGLLYLNIKDYKQAESSFLKATVYSPNNVVYMVNLGATYERDRNYNSALDVYKEAYKVDPKYRGLKESIIRTKSILGIITVTNNNFESISKKIEYDADTEVRPIEMDNIINTNTIETNNFINTNIIETNNINII